MAAGVAELVVRVVSDVKGATKGLDDVASRADRMKAGLGTAAKVSGAALLGLGAAAISAGNAAAEDARGQALLAQQLKANAGATDESIASTEAWIDKTARATGVADDQLRPALASLVRVTGDTAKSQDALSTAMDVSAATGADVEAVSKAIAKGFAGSTGALAKLVPGLDEAALKAGDMDAIMGQLADKTGGAAAAAAESTAGQMQRMGVSIDEAKESLGAGLLPIMATFAGILATVGGFVSQHTTLFQTLAVVLAGLAVAVIAVNAAVKAYRAITLIATAAQAAFNLVMALNPVVLVVIAVVALIAAVVILVKKNEAVRAAFASAWAGIQAAVSSVVSFLTGLWGGFVGFLQRSGASIAAGYEKTWGQIKSGAEAVRDWVVEKFHALQDKVGAIGEAIQSAWDRVWGALESAAENFVNNVTHPLEAIKGLFDDIVGAVQDLISWIGKIHIPDLGGIGGLVGRVVPGMAPAPSVTGLSSSRAVASSGVNITVNGAIDPEATARQIQRILAGHDRRVGLAP